MVNQYQQHWNSTCLWIYASSIVTCLQQSKQAAWLLPSPGMNLAGHDDEGYEAC